MTEKEHDRAIATGECMVHSLTQEGFTPVIVIGFSKATDKDPIKSIHVGTLSKSSVMRILTETLYKLALCPDDSFHGKDTP